MSKTIYAEAVLAGTSLALGAGLMALYDIFRIWRVLFPHGMLWTGLEDLLYWLFSGVSPFLLLFYQNDGVLRCYAVGGVFLGMLLYQWTVSRILQRVLKKAEKYHTMKKRKRLRQLKRKQSDWRRKNGDRNNDGKETENGERKGKTKEKRKSE